MLWKNYFFTADFTDDAEFLKRFNQGDVLTGTDADGMSGVFQKNDPHVSKKHLWNTRPTHDYSLEGAVVVYNGPNSDMMPTNSKYTHVMTLDFKETECEQPDGRVHLHYNL